MEGTHTKNGWQQNTQNIFKLQTWREKKYIKITNEMGRWFPGGRNRPRGLSLIVDDGDGYLADSRWEIKCSVYAYDIHENSSKIHLQQEAGCFHKMSIIQHIKFYITLGCLYFVREALTGVKCSTSCWQTNNFHAKVERYNTLISY